MGDLRGLRDRLAACEKQDWRLDEEVVEVFGQIRLVSGLGMNGRTPGQYRYFGPKSKSRYGSPVPKPTKNAETRAAWVKKLDAAILRALEAEGRG